MLQLGFWNFLLPSILSNAFKKKPLGETPVWMPGILDIHIALGMKVSGDLCKEGQAAVNLRIANPYVVAVLFSLESCQLKSLNFDTKRLWSWQDIELNAGNCQSPCFMWRVFQLPFDVYQLPLQLTMCSAIENHLKKIAKHWTMLCPEKLEHIAATTSKTRFLRCQKCRGVGILCLRAFYTIAMYIL